ncbi:MAG: hypothetical protein SFY66_27715 [Oculatellaceae cyanobacterium bins.114]|nr:hypothetical protein [Oculatellaceae cyanobacterium bins.114]
MCHAAIANNRASIDLQMTQIDGIEYEYWVDREAGFTAQDQIDLI